MNQPMNQLGKWQPIKSILVGTVALLAVGTVADGLFNSGLMTQRATAIVGRPATPRQRCRSRPTHYPPGDSAIDHLRGQSAGELFHRDH